MENETNANHRTSCFYIERFSGNVGNIADVYTVSVVFNVLLSLTAVSGNALVIAGIWFKPSLRSPSNVLLLSLAFSDLCVGLVVQPLYAVYKLTGPSTNGSELHCSAGVAFNLTSSTLASASILTLTAVSMDIYFKFALHLRYPVLVTMRKVEVVLGCVWFLSVLLALSWLWNLQVYYILGSISSVICIATISFTYFKVYRLINYHRRAIKLQVVCSDVNHQHGQTRRHRNSALSMFMVYVAFLICSLPFSCTLAAVLVVGRNIRTETAFNFTMLLLFSNSTLNPVLICWRIKEVRSAVWGMLRKLCPNFPTPTVNPLSIE